MSWRRRDRPGADPAADLGGFRPDGTGVTARFVAGQAAIIRNLVRQVAELVDPGPAGSLAPDGPLTALLGITEEAERPADPILARLLPDVYAEDEQAAAEFRRYTELGLRSGKIQNARTVLSTLPEQGGPVRLSADEARAWMRSINDVRLSLGVVLGVTDDSDDLTDGLTDGDPRAAYVGVYQWLAFVQETLVEALS